MVIVLGWVYTTRIVWIHRISEDRVLYIRIELLIVMVSHGKNLLPKQTKLDQARANVNRNGLLTWLGTLISVPKGD